MVGDYDLDDLQAISKEENDRTENAMRSAIKEIEDGIYDYKMQTDGPVSYTHLTLPTSDLV